MTEPYLKDCPECGKRTFDYIELRRLWRCLECGYEEGGEDLTEPRFLGKFRGFKLHVREGNKSEGDCVFMINEIDFSDVLLLMAVKFRGRIADTNYSEGLGKEYVLDTLKDAIAGMEIKDIMENYKWKVKLSPSDEATLDRFERFYRAHIKKFPLTKDKKYLYLPEGVVTFDEMEKDMKEGKKKEVKDSEEE